MAGTQEEFILKVKHLLPTFEETFSQSLSWKMIEHQFSIYSPTSAHALGATNKTIFHGIIRILRAEGIITDAIYSAKLFLTAEKLLQKNHD